MKKFIKFIAIGAVAGAMSVQAQEQLQWYNAGQQVGPNNADFLTNGVDETSGVLVQLILAADQTTPAAGGAPDYGSPNPGGVTGGDVMLAATFIGKGGGAPGVFFDSGDLIPFGPYGMTNNSQIYIRIFDNPSTDAAGSLPAPMTYTDPTVLGFYPGAAGTPGVFYHDYAVQQPDPLGGGFFAYEAAGAPLFAGDTGWTFLASPIPEPSTLVFALLGLFGVRAFRRRK